MPNTARPIAALLIGLSVAACGGGGGGGGSDDPARGSGAGASARAAFAATSLTGAAGSTAQFDASPSSGEGLSYYWSFGDGQSSSGSHTSHVYATPGQYVVTLTVTDRRGSSSSSTLEVLVSPPDGNLSPTAQFSADRYSGGAGVTVAFDASGSSDADGIANYAWDFGDGHSGTGLHASHQYTSPGTYTVQLRVEDTRGASSRASATITVGAVQDDPRYSDQWHLENLGQLGGDGSLGVPGEDLHVAPAWSCSGATTCRGEGRTIAVVDDGLEIAHEDLARNISTRLNSWDYCAGAAPAACDTAASGDPTPADGSAHGTAVAGIIAARDLNGTGGRGVAPRAELVGYNLLENTTTSNEAHAMSYQAAAVDISNNSWGPADGTGWLIPAEALWVVALRNGLATGRGGRGTVYVWAAGNGYDGSVRCDSCRDNSNYDGYANRRGVIATAAVTAQGRRASYSEPGANIVVSAPGGEYCNALAITTTDRSGADGYDASNYTDCMNGSSAAAPMVSGVAALMLQANPRLSWRDVREILARTARRNDPTDADWSLNGAGLHVNHSYGFGVADAQAAVAAAATWTPLPPQRGYHSGTISVGSVIPDDNTRLDSDFLVSGSGITELEWVEVVFSASDHSYSGDLEIVLVSPSGTHSVLAQQHDCASDSCEPYQGWRFASARHLGESADGSWQLQVRDASSGDSGTFQSWQLRLYGR